MFFIDEKTVEKLKRGDFSYAPLNTWFSNHAFDYIYAIVDGCDKNLNFDMLNYVSIFAQYLLREPNANDWVEEGELRRLIINANYCYPGIDDMTRDELVEKWNKVIVNNCEAILKKVIEVSCKHPDCYGQIVRDLSKHENDNLRLWCCAKAEDFTPFLNDNCPRVRKVANIRYDFEQRIPGLYPWDEDAKRNEFLTAALEIHAIDCYNGCVAYEGEEDKAYARFESLLFENPYTDPKFDLDVLEVISDKRILADKLNDLINEDKISFKEGVAPSCFKKNSPVLKKTNN